MAEDLHGILAVTQPVWKELDGASLFITGGTGFFGRWLLEALAWANHVGGYRVKATVLTRDPAGFAKRAPELAKLPFLELVEGDVRTFDFPAAPADYILHAATDTTNLVQTEAAYSAITDGTKRVLELASAVGARRLLYVSSGAVYGKLNSAMPLPSESDEIVSTPEEPFDAYRDGKRTSERLVLDSKGSVSIARCFAFHGPYLPLNAHYAIGNFIGNRLRNEPIHVGGDGTPLRSYLYAADLAAWLYTILVKGLDRGIYNVGSDASLSIGELAHKIGADFSPELPVHIAKVPNPDAPAPSYVPNVTRIKKDLGVTETVSLADGIAKTLKWLQTRAV